MAYIRCSDETHRAIKIAAANLGVSMQQVLDRAFDVFAKSVPGESSARHLTSVGPARPEGVHYARHHKWHKMLDDILESGVKQAIAACTAVLTAMKDVADDRLAAPAPGQRTTT
jgi:hypothetical protein